MKREHRFVTAHYADSGAITRVCVHCHTRRVLYPNGDVEFVSFSGARSAEEPACVPLVSAGQTGAAA